MNAPVFRRLCAFFLALAAPFFLASCNVPDDAAPKTPDPVETPAPAPASHRDGSLRLALILSDLSAENKAIADAASQRANELGLSLVSLRPRNADAKEQALQLRDALQANLEVVILAPAGEGVLAEGQALASGPGASLLLFLPGGEEAEADAAATIAPALDQAAADLVACALGQSGEATGAILLQEEGAAGEARAAALTAALQSAGIETIETVLLAEGVRAGEATARLSRRTGASLPLVFATSERAALDARAGFPASRRWLPLFFSFGGEGVSLPLGGGLTASARMDEAAVGRLLIDAADALLAGDLPQGHRISYPLSLLLPEEAS